MESQLPPRKRKDEEDAVVGEDGEGGGGFDWLSIGKGAGKVAGYVLVFLGLKNVVVPFIVRILHFVFWLFIGIIVATFLAKGIGMLIRAAKVNNLTKCLQQETANLEALKAQLGLPEDQVLPTAPAAAPAPTPATATAAAA